MVYVAVDIGKRRCVTCVMDQDGSILDSGSYPNTMLDASHYARQTVEKYGECKAVVESTGNMCMKTYEAFESNGVEVKLANPVKTRAIVEARVKTDNHNEPFAVWLVQPSHLFFSRGWHTTIRGSNPIFQ